MKSKNRTDSQRRTNSLDFFRGFLREPGIVGSIIPSSRYLEQRIINAADLANARLVVELGPGTGGTTRSLLNHLPANAQLLTIEVSAAFVEVLDGIDDPRLINHCGSAADLEDILSQHQLPGADAVISGIPFSTMPDAVGRQVIDAVWRSLAPGGHFVAYQFRDHVATLARPLIGVPEIRMEMRNIPPMRVFRWQRPGNNKAASDPA
ncbi:phospholipid N-methyltransferase [Methylohalomonas lacus]|uniref:Phospholipid N-methyltransferase n=1 Tax=Methylohalomonas lacus TaxID=398773 RepID=A0AAE3HIP3_9GAMM|nr:methyltransferase domain-containing protein [Methylohalomonas lacus]MCS3903060.1 phospholipid N-methyltransferase [Methylohalomonas lacus]